MRNISVFQLVVLGIFFVALLVGFLVVAIYSSNSSATQNQLIRVQIWGTLDAGEVNAAINKVGHGTTGNLKITYTQMPESTFENDLLEAIATGSGPDVVIIRDDTAASSLSKLTLIPYDSFPARDFKDSFVEGGELFLTGKGIVGIPFAVDPLVMYWNRDMFARAGLANPPKLWDEVFSLAQELTQKDSSGAIMQSGVALGAYQNVLNAKAILSALFLQSGNTISVWSDRTSSVKITLQQAPVAPASVLSFYTQFSDPRKSVLSWNQALPDSKSMFLSNRLAIYFGFASELADIRQKSPNLNFDVAELPQSRDAAFTGTYGHLYGLGVLKSAKDVPGSITAIKLLTAADPIRVASEAAGLPPVRKDVSISSADPYQKLFANAAIVTHAWLDPDRTVSDAAFKDMVESVISGFVGPAEAISKAAQQLQYAAPR